MTQEEYNALPKEQKEQILANAAALVKSQLEIEKEKESFKEMTIKDFTNKVKEIIEEQIKPMTKVDRKFFAFPGIGYVDGDISPEGKFGKMKKFLRALAHADVNVARQLSEEVRVKANLSEGAVGAGGYLVPEEFKAEVLRLMPLYGVIRKEVRIIPMRYDVLNIPAAGATDQSAIWTQEAAQILQTNPNFTQVTLTINKLAAIPKVTNELLADADVDVIQYLAELIAEAFAQAEDQQGFLGTGSPFIGVCESTGSPTSAIPVGTISALSYPDLVVATGSIYANALEGAKFYLHRSIIANIKAMITTAGAPIFSATANDIVGYPLVSCEKLRSVAAMGASDGTTYGIFGNIRRGYAMGERGAITMKLSEEATVDSDNLFEKDMVALRMIERVAMGILLPSAFVRLTT